MNVVQMGARTVGDGAPCFITFEAGPTHDGVETASALVKLAAEAGADAVKFQVVDPDRICADRTALFHYEVLVDRATGATRPTSEPLYDLLKRRALSIDEWREVKAAADAHGVAFFATAAFPDEVAFLAEIGCASIKIASGDVNHLPLIQLAAETGMCVQLDTGNSTLGEIERAVDVCVAAGNENIIIHQCPSGYPARVESINLNILTTLKQMFGYPVAYSDHVPGWEMDVAALAMGANLLEKTITFDRTTPSIEHMFSLEPDEMPHFVRIVRDVESAMGRRRRVMHAEELKKRGAARRSAYLVEDAKAGTALGAVAFEYRRPAGGVAPDVVFENAERRLARDLAAGARLEFSDLA